MKVALISYPRHEINSSTPSGIELFTYFLANGLAQNSQTTSIDVYSVGKSYFDHPKIHFNSVLHETADTYISTNKFFRSLHQAPDALLAKLLNNLENKTFSLLAKNSYDIIHNNSTSPLFSTLKKILKAPVITTLHTKVNTAGIIIPYTLNLIDSNDKYVAISNNQIEQANKYEIRLSFIKTIYNGINCHEYKCNINSDTKDQGVWLGRINPTDNKGLKEAIQSSKIARKKLSISGVVTDQNFFRYPNQANIKHK